MNLKKLFLGTLVSGMTFVPVTYAQSSITNPAFLEKNGVAVVEIESVGPGIGWRRENRIAGYKGSAYYVYSGPQRLAGSPTGVMTYRVKIASPGNYQFVARQRIGTGSSITEHNDSWVQFPTGRNVSGEWPLQGWTKFYMNRLNNWIYSTSTKDHDPRPLRRYFNAGVHEIKIGGRSTGHIIDRFVLFKYGQVANSPRNFDAMPQSARE